MKQLIAASVLVCLASSVLADSWLPPRPQGKSSASGTYVVRVEPGSSMGDVAGFAGAPAGPYAVAELFRYDGRGYVRVHRTTLLNPIAPVAIEVTERGELITLDNWLNMGGGSVLAIYAPDGKVVKQFTLRDLYAEKDVKRMYTTVSSIHWRCESVAPVLDTPEELQIDDRLGGRFIINVATAKFAYHATLGTCRK